MDRQEHWTKSAIDCYKRGGVCKGCIYETFFARREYKCQMKATVISLVEHLGAPPNTESAGVYDEDDEYLGG